MSTLFIYSHTKGNIDYYKVNPEFDVYIKAIRLSDGHIDWKKIIEYSIHRDLEMYKVHDPKSRFKDFWVSSDHSLIVYNGEQYLKCSPLSVLENPNRFSLVQEKNGTKIFIPCSELEIVLDPDITEAADFTVEDYYTFCTADGVFVQDTVALYRPLTQRAIQECENYMWTPKNVFSAANMTVQFKAKQGIVYGIYKLTSTPEGRKLFKETLGLDYEITDPVTSKKLTEIITNECRKGNIDVLDKVKVLGFSTSVVNPETISILDLKPVEVNITGDKEKDIVEIQRVTEEIKQKFSKRDIVESGARASWDQIRQIIGTRGYVSNFFGNIVSIPVKKSYAEGLSPEDYFISCYGARKGILDVAENTATSGYLTRKLIYATITCELDLDLDDCGTDFCIKYTIDDYDLAKALVGRYYYPDDETDELLCVTSPDDIYKKTIYLRTPMLCESKKICKKCYGELANIHKSKYVGVIAAQTIGERSVQLVLRTFHTAGVAQGKKLDKQEDIVSTMRSISSLDKDVPVRDILEAFDYTVDLWRMFKEYGYLHLVHFEIITAQRLWAELADKYVRYRTNIPELEKYEVYDNYGRLIDADYTLNLVSLKKIASLESWFLGMVFQDARKNFIKGLLHDSSQMSMLEKIVLGQIL